MTGLVPQPRRGYEDEGDSDDVLVRVHPRGGPVGDSSAMLGRYFTIQPWRC
jgi:hypothetical protein